jgi:hypothetical protein
MGRRSGKKGNRSSRLSARQLRNQAKIIPGTHDTKYKLRRRELKKMSPSTGPSAFGLAIARVQRVDYVKHEATLQIIYGEAEAPHQYTPVPITYPGAGTRTFLGVMPEVGDLCVVGWLSTDSKIPVILSWIPSAATSGLSWLVTQDFLPSETDLSPKKRSEFEGIFGRYRHKIRQMSPGMVYMSSTQGSDIIMDEGVQIQNRRNNEIRIRDQDQAIVMKSLQQFHAAGGTRLYAGMVQRDADRLPHRVISDGIDWKGAVQEIDGEPVDPATRPPSKDLPGSLIPHAVFKRSDATTPQTASGIFVPDNVDPYTLGSRGLFLNPDGFARNPNRIVSDGEYGGKPIFRVSYDPDPTIAALPVNGAIADGDADTLTEYRIELNHTWDGSLPVTEQTDGFDADRIPTNAYGESASSSSGPFLEFVLGSVVGNDPFTARGKDLYGIPLVPRIFDGTKVAPRLESGIGVPLGEHGATLLRVTDPLADTSQTQPAFVSLTKDGRAKAFLSGPQNQDSLELAVAGGIRIEAQDRISLKASYIDLDFSNGDPENNFAAAIRSNTGAVLISGTAPTTRGSFSSRGSGNVLQESSLPAVAVESSNGNVHVTAGGTAKVSGANAVQLTDTNEILLSAKQAINHFSDKFVIQTNTLDRTVQGRETQLYSGPKNSLPSNSPIRETKFIASPLTGHAGGTTDEYFMLFGDRVEKFTIGNHRTTISVGDMTWRANVGTITHQAGVNASRLSTSSGYRLTVPTGTVAISATLSVSVKALASLTLKATGTAKLSGSVTTLGGFGKVGRIMSSADLDPLTNLPYSFFGIGSFGHRIGTPI